MNNTQEHATASVRFGEFKGRKTITLNPASRFPFTFGLGKAVLIVENIEAIKKFVFDQSIVENMVAVESEEGK